MTDFQRGHIAAQLGEPFDQTKSEEWKNGYLDEIKNPTGGLEPQKGDRNMTVKNIVERAQKQIEIKTVIIWNPNISKALFVGSINNIPKQLLNKTVISYRYSATKFRFIMRVSS